MLVKRAHEEVDFGVGFGAAGSAARGHSADSKTARFRIRFCSPTLNFWGWGGSRNGDSGWPVLQSVVAKLYPLLL